MKGVADNLVTVQLVIDSADEDLLATLIKLKDHDKIVSMVERLQHAQEIATRHDRDDEVRDLQKTIDVCNAFIDRDLLNEIVASGAEPDNIIV